MRTYVECAPCFMRQLLDSAELTSADDSCVGDIVRQAHLYLADADMKLSPPEHAMYLHNLLRKRTNTADPYSSIKKRCNLQMMAYEEQFRELIESSDASFATAVHLAIAGNLIDFGVGSDLNEENMISQVEEMIGFPLIRDDSMELYERIQSAESIVYLADNSGEIVADKLLIELYMAAKTTVIVRNGPIINDATMEDADMVGLTRITRVIPNGIIPSLPGTVVEKMSSECQVLFQEADVVISKGQGNYETLSDCKRDIFFLFKAKCPVVTHKINCSLGDTLCWHYTG